MILTVPPLEAKGKAWPTLGPQVCAWMRTNLVHGPGDLRGMPFTLDDEKEAIIARAYEVYPKGHAQAGRRRFKRVAISVRKGWAKTELAAALAAAELAPDAPVRCVGWDKKGNPIGGPVTDPFVPMVAYTEEQSDELAYAALKVMLEPIAGQFDIGGERIMRANGDGKAVSLSSSPSGNDGARTTFQVFDEPLALDTPVPTVEGWKELGELTEADFVFGRDGRPLRVLGASPIHSDRPCFRVHFVGGSSVVTDAKHRWKAIDWSNRPRGEQVVTTEEMYSRGTRTKYGRRWRLPRGSGVDGREACLPIAPYLLGLWLGDGSTNAGYIHSSPADYKELSAQIPHTVSDDKNVDVVRWLPRGLRASLRANQLLGRKRIPAYYSFASREQRIELLRGLMDSDGHATTKTGLCTFVQKHRALAEEVQSLVRSLGCAASICRSEEVRSRTGEIWKVHFSPAFSPFNLKRKAERFEWRKRCATWWPSIESIEPCESVPVRCIAVEGDDHLFVVGRAFNLTHNTHRFNTPRLRKAHATMLANIPKRRAADAWSMEITTSYAPGEESIAEGTMKYARDVRDGKIKDSKLFFFHRQASESIELFDSDGALIVDNLKRAVDEASGPVAVWSDTDGILSQFQDPSADIPYLRRVWLNQAVRATDRAFNTDIYAKLARPGATIPPGADVVLSFDGSRREDSSCLIATEIATGLQIVVGLWEKPESERVEKGKEHGEIASEWEIPSAEVNAAVKLAFDTWNVWRFYADPPKWEETVALWAAEYGEDRVIRFFTNQWSLMALAVDAFDTAVKAGEIHHDGDPRLVRHVGNCHRLYIGKRNDKGEKMFVVVKENKGSLNKIDAAVTLIIGNQARLHALAEGIGAGSIYDSNGGHMEVW